MLVFDSHSARSTNPPSLTVLRDGVDPKVKGKSDVELVEVPKISLFINSEEMEANNGTTLALRPPLSSSTTNRQSRCPGW